MITTPPTSIAVVKTVPRVTKTKCIQRETFSGCKGKKNCWGVKLCVHKVVHTIFIASYLSHICSKLFHNRVPSHSFFRITINISPWEYRRVCPMIVFVNDRPVGSSSFKS